jgi:hypothetical protein
VNHGSIFSMPTLLTFSTNRFCRLSPSNRFVNWDDIEDAIRNHAAKVVVVLSCVASDVASRDAGQPC